MERDRNGMRVYDGECAGSRSVSRPRKRWSTTVKECLKKRGLDVRQGRRMIQDRSEWQGLVRGNAWAVSRGTNPDLDGMWVVSCHSYMKPLKGRSPFLAEPTT